MNVNTFLEQFGHLADAPKGIKKLRELILDLAIRGKLVRQDLEDEPAKKLLERIYSEREKLIIDGVIKKTSIYSLKKIIEQKDLPPGWISIYLGSCISLVSGQHLTANCYNETGEGTPYLTGPADFGDVSPKATRWTHERRALAKRGDILITVKGSGVGKTNVLNTDFAFSFEYRLCIYKSSTNGD